MKIDTLILCGNAEKALSFLGSLTALFEKNIIKKKFKNIKHIICVSGGALMITATLLLLFNNYNINQIIHILLKLDTNPKLHFSDIKLDDMVDMFYIYKNDDLVKYHKRIINIFYGKEDLTLKELYDFVPIKISVKVLNLTDNKTEYINYKNNPNFSLLTLLKATSCIPIIFKPILYNNKYYIDGGTHCSIPIDYCKSKNYLVLMYKSYNDNIYPNINFAQYIKKLIETQVDSIIYDRYIKDNDRIIYIKFNLSTELLYNGVEDKKKMIIYGYNDSINYLTSRTNCLGKI